MAEAIIKTLEESTDKERLRKRTAEFSIEKSVSKLETLFNETVKAHELIICGNEVNANN